MLSDGSFDGLGGFIVEDVELGSEAVLGEDAVELFIGSESFYITAVFHGLDEDCVAVVFVEDKEVLVAGLGSNGESSSEIGVYNAVVDVSKPDGGKNTVRWGWLLLGKMISIVTVGVRAGGGELGWFRFRGAAVLGRLIEVALGCGDGLG